MIKNYIFDFDGTLMDTAPVILSTMRATIEELGLPEKTEAECRATIGLRLEEIPKALFPEREDIGEEYAATYRRLFPLYNKPGVARPFPNVIDTIKTLHADGHGLAIASSRSHKSLEEFVREMNLTDAFQILIAGDDVKHGKPSPEPVLTILERMDWKAEETLVIGDAAVDIQMGKAAGCKTCAVTYGNGTREELEGAQPDFMIDNFAGMIKFDFDKAIDRRGTNSLKYDGLQERYGRTDLTPLWVADMDFETPDFIRVEVQRIAVQQVYGYTLAPADYKPTIIDWVRSHYGYEIQAEWISFIPGVVRGIGFVVNHFTRPGDRIIIQPPVYHPFRLVPQGNGREIVCNPLIERDGTYEMDFDQLATVADGARLMIIANPHNPAGIVWPKETLQRLASFCCEHGITVVSDEIHCDLNLWHLPHHVFTSVSPEAERCGIVFQAPTKTFNVAGFATSHCIIPNSELREPFFRWLNENEWDMAHMMAQPVTVAAFRHGEEWRQQLLRYIEGNIEAVERFSAERIPQIIPWRPQASYLVWLDCRKLRLSLDGLLDLFENRARLALNNGAMFGHGGRGFMRLNVGCPRSVLMEAMERLAEAVEKEGNN